MYFMFDEFNIFLHTKSYPLAVLLETAEQTLRPGMYDLSDRDQNHPNFPDLKNYRLIEKFSVECRK